MHRAPSNVPGVMEDADGNRLVQIQVVHRHGARAPESGLQFPSICGRLAFRTFFSFTPRVGPVTSLWPFSRVPFADNDASCYPGQLTPLGAAQMFALGARLRARYPSLIPERFDPQRIVVRSTALQRTVESAVATLSGMFPADGGDVDVEVRESNSETMVTLKGCSRLIDLQKAVYASFVFPAVLEDVERGWLSSKGKTGRHSALALRDIALSLKGNGLEPVSWGTAAEQSVAKTISSIFHKETAGLRLGRFVEELLDEAEAHADLPWRVKLYSGHDTTLLPLMACLEDDTTRGVPDFAADVVLETWQPPTGSETKIRIKYTGEDVIVKGCEQYGALCPVSIMRQAVRSRIPNNLEQACNGTAADADPGKAAAEGTSIK